MLPTPLCYSWRHPGPCLAVGINGRYKCPYEELACNFPRCLTMATNDETCVAGSHDVRQYYTSRMADRGYLPLGPRVDAWGSFQRLQSMPSFVMLPASRRRYAFNAIFTGNTHRGRRGLVQLLEGYGRSQFEVSGETKETFVWIVPTWYPDVNNPHTPQLNTDEYMKALSESVFTLSPAGHNPECFRLYEAVEAGSIPGP